MWKKQTFLHFSVNDVQKPLVTIVEQIVWQQFGNDQKSVFFVEQSLGLTQSTVVQCESEIRLEQGRIGLDRGHGGLSRDAVETLIDRCGVRDPERQREWGIAGVRGRGVL